jgi:hypothetical protein
MTWCHIQSLPVHVLDHQSVAQVLAKDALYLPPDTTALRLGLNLTTPPNPGSTYCRVVQGPPTDKKVHVYRAR